MTDWIGQIKIGIVIISIGLLTLLYPLMYSYLANLMHQLFELEKMIKDKEKKPPSQIPEAKEPVDKITAYYHKSSFTLNIFFPTGLGFVFTFILLQCLYERHFCIFLFKLSIFLILLFLCFWVIYLWCREFRPKEMKWYKFLFSKESRFLLWFIPFWAYITCSIICIFTIPKIQFYCLLLNHGVLLAYLVALWFGEGVYYGTIRNLTDLREIILR